MCTARPRRMAVRPGRWRATLRNEPPPTISPLLTLANEAFSCARQVINVGIANEVPQLRGRRLSDTNRLLAKWR